MDRNIRQHTPAHPRRDRRGRPPSGILTLALAVCLCGGCLPTATPVTPSPRAEQAPTSTPTATLTAQPTPPASPTAATATAVALGFDAEALPLSSVAYRIPLTLRLVTQSAAVLFFELDAPSPGEVYLLAPNPATPPIKATLSPTETRQRITFDGLTAGTPYEAVVVLRSDGGSPFQPNFQGRRWGPVTVRTLPPSGPVRFAAIGDASFGDPTTRALVDQMAADGIDFVLHAGDVLDETESGVNPYESYASKFYDVFEPVLRLAPVYTVPGNHDYDLDIRYQDEPFYFRAFPSFQDADAAALDAAARNQFYEFDAAGVRFLMLDSQVLFGAPGRQAETDWLTDRLTETGYRGTVVVLHVAPFSSSSVHPGDSLPVRSAWVPLFEQAHVSLVISGHFHQYERLSVNGIPYLVTGGGSSTLYAPGPILPQSQAFRRQSHYVLGVIRDNVLELTAIGLDGQIIDRFTIPLGP